MRLLTVAALGALAPAPLAQPARIVAPPAAFPGGTITGVVLDAQDRRVSGAPVELTTLTGEVISTETDGQGRYALAVPPAPTASLRLGDGTVEVPLASAEDAGAFPDRAPALASAASGFTLQGVATGGWAEGAGGRASLPLATAAPARGDGLTHVYLPPGLAAGPATVTLRRPDGGLVRHALAVYRITDAELDRESLRSGQDADFAFRFDFGRGPERTVIATVTTTGPVAYEANGRPQRVEVDDDGEAELEGTIEALQGSPSGTPFSIQIQVAPGDGWPAQPAPTEPAEAPPTGPLGVPTVDPTPPSDLAIPTMTVVVSLGPGAQLAAVPPCTDCASIRTLLRAAERHARSFRSEAGRHRRDRRWAVDDAEWVREDQARDRAYLETRRRQARYWRDLAARGRADADADRERHRRDPDAGWDRWAEADDARARQRDQNAADIEAEVRRIEAEQIDPEARVRALDRAVAEAERQAEHWEAESARLLRAHEECLRRAEACPEDDAPRDAGGPADGARDVGSDDAICGPDVTAPLLALLDIMARDYAAQDADVQADACDNLTEIVGDGTITALYAWDLIPFHPGNTPGQSRDGTPRPVSPNGPWFEGVSNQCAIPRHYPCGPTVEFLGQCVHAQVLNYIQWGVANELCGNTLDANFWHWARELGGTSDAYAAQRLIADLGRSFVSLRELYTELADDDPDYYTPALVAERRRAQLSERWEELTEASAEWARRQGAECAPACRLTPAQQDRLIRNSGWNYVWQGVPGHNRRERD